MREKRKREEESSECKSLGKDVVEEPVRRQRRHKQDVEESVKGEKTI